VRKPPVAVTTLAKIIACAWVSLRFPDGFLCPLTCTLARDGDISPCAAMD
jgi:hypothetical protein